MIVLVILGSAIVGALFGFFACALAVASQRADEVIGTVEAAEMDGPTGPMYASIRFTRGMPYREGDIIGTTLRREGGS